MKPLRKAGSALSFDVNFSDCSKTCFYATKPILSRNGNGEGVRRTGELLPKSPRCLAHKANLPKNFYGLFTILLFMPTPSRRRTPAAIG